MHQSGPSTSISHANDTANHPSFADREGQTLGQLAYWQRQLDAAPLMLQLPTDRPRLAVQTFHGLTHTFVLPQRLSVALRELSRQEEVTLFMTLLAAFQLLLFRYTGQEDIVVGTPIDIRIESSTANFVNTLVLRTKLSGDASFRDLLRRVQEVTLGAYVHQDLPFEKLVEELQSVRDMSRYPLFQVLFALHDGPKECPGMSGLTPRPLDVEHETMSCELALEMWETQNSLCGSFTYNLELFEAMTIRRMVGHFQTLLESIVADPEQHLSKPTLLTEDEHRQLLIEWNDTRTEYHKDMGMHELFEAQVERTPDLVAVVYEGEHLTYRELNRRANQLAHHLQKLGVGPEVLVGICLERSLDLVVGVLGILKAGGAYVPLDLAYPQERLAFMLEDTQLAVLVMQEQLVERLPAHTAKVVCLDTDSEAIARESAANPSSGVTSENLAYIVYTSGSTGRPKGVAIEQHNVVTFLHWARDVFEPAELAGVLAATSICFDLSVFELFVPLSWGGKVLLAENVLHLPTLQAAEEVTLINTVPSAMIELLRVHKLPTSVVTVNLAGEPLQRVLVQELYQHPTIQRVFNLYGPSEDTTYSTYVLIKRDAASSKTPSVGRPIADTQVYVLDSHLQLVPVGIPGEGYIGGEGLARGYLNRPELTAERFIPHPFSDEPGKRLYKTGDLARYLPGGNLELLGRSDHQVKIRGFRIEPGEIEAVLCQHPAVSEAVVMAWEDSNGDKRLVAYIAAWPGQQATLTTRALRNFLKERLPEYMVPSMLVVLDILPRMPNEKINRDALPAPDQVKSIEPEEIYVAPRNPVEQVLTMIWADVLGLERVGIRDNFLELGGHSLLAIRIMAQLQEIFQVELPLSCLFEEPTVLELARRVETAGRTLQQDTIKIAQVFIRLNQLSDDEIQALLAERHG